jgi:hypothetical protein
MREKARKFPEHPGVAGFDLEQGARLMEPQDKTAREHDPQHETALQEIVHETRATSVRTWTVTGIIVAVLLTVMYVVTTHRADEEAAHRSAVSNEIQSQAGGT